MRSSPWIVSLRADVGIVVLPLIAAVLSLATLSDRGPDVPLWAFLIVIVAFDVAHVWATAYLTYLDEEVRQRRPLLLWGTPLLAFLASWRLHSHSPTLFWTLLAYVAIFHFIRQQWGFIALYRARCSERSSFDFHLDKWTLWVGALGPVLLWHASPARQFDWFNAGESFIATIDPALRPDIAAIWAAFGVFWVARQLQLWRQKQQWNPGKVLWMTSSWLSWGVGIGLSDHALVSAAFLNLLHGVPFLALVWYRCNERWQEQDRGHSKVLAWLAQRRRWLAFYALILGLAVVEESLWDAAVWQVYLPDLLALDLPEPGAGTLSLIVAALSVPQIVHYILDAWIWRFNDSNPDLLELFGWLRR